MTAFTICWNTPSQSGIWDALTDENLKRVGIRREDIMFVEPFFAFTGALYPEANVARYGHLCCGSTGAWIYTSDGNMASIQLIGYYDEGHKSGSLKGVPHWNLENRFIDIDGKGDRVKTKKNHIINDSKAIEFTYIDLSGETKSCIVNSTASI